MALARIPRFVLGVGIVVLSLLVLLSATVPATVNGQLVRAPRRELPSAAQVVPPPVQPASVGQVLRTLVLFNNTDKPGNFLPRTAFNPNAVIYDTHDHTAWVSVGTLLGILDVPGANGIAYVPAPAPWGLAYDNVSNEILATDYAGLNASVYAGTTHQRVGTVELGSGPIAAAYDWRTNEFYVSNAHSNNVSVIDAANLHVIASVSVGTIPQGLAYVPVTGEVFVANSQSNNVSVISETTHAVVATVSIASSAPGSVLYDPANQLVYVGGAVSVWPVNPVGRAVSSPISMVGGYTLALDPNAGVLYAPDYNAGVVKFAATSSGAVLGSVNLGTYAYPDSAAYDPVDGRILVSAYNYYQFLSSNVSVISTTTHAIVGSIGLEHLPSAELYDASTHSIYVYDGGTGDVYQIDDTTDLITRSVFVGYTPHTSVPYSGLALDPSTNALYVDYYSLAGSVAVVDRTTFTVTKVLPAADFNDPTGIVFDSVDHRLFVVNYLASNLTVVDTSTNSAIGWIAVGSHPVGITSDPANDQVYVANSQSNNVSVISGASQTVVATVTAGNGPFGVAYDPTNGDVYVSNANGNNVTAISGRSNRTVANITVTLVNYPLFLAYDSVNDTILVGSWGNGAVTGQVGLIDAATQTWTGAVDVGTYPVGMVYDPAQHAAFVANDFPGSISVVAFGNTVVPLALTTFAASPASIGLGQTTDLVVTTTGGSGPLTYAYSTLPPGCASADVASLPCTPTAAGTYSIGVNVTDSAGGHVSGATSLHVTPPTPLQVTAFGVSPSTITLNGSVTFTVSASGGVPPLTYAYQGLPPGCASANRSSLTCTPTATGTFTVSAVVNDTAGHSVTAHTSLTVTPGSSGGGPSPSGSGGPPVPIWVWAGLGIALVAVGVLLAVLRRRRGSRPGDPGGGQPPHGPPG